MRHAGAELAPDKIRGRHPVFVSWTSLLHYDLEKLDTGFRRYDERAVDFKSTGSEPLGLEPRVVQFVCGLLIFSSELSALRLCGRIFGVRGASISGKLARLAQIFTYRIAKGAKRICDCRGDRLVALVRREFRASIARHR
jgi:hypothetical protein